MDCIVTRDGIVFESGYALVKEIDGQSRRVSYDVFMRMSQLAYANTRKKEPYQELESRLRGGWVITKMRFEPRLKIEYTDVDYQESLFVSWLKRFEHTAVLGFFGHHNNNPISIWRASAFGEQVSLASWHVATWMVGTWHMMVAHMPEWVEQLYNELKILKLITVGDCLRVLTRSV
jgi:hypothetical protein